MKKSGRRRGHAFGAAIHALTEMEHTLEVTTNPLGENHRPLDPVDVIEQTIYEAYLDVHPSDQTEQDEVDFELHALPQIVLGYVDLYGVRVRREIEFYLPLINPATGRSSRTFTRGGKIDGLEFRDGRAILIEDKLVSQITKVMIDHTMLDLQTCEYVDALLARGYGNPTIKFRHTRFPTIRVRKNESQAGFRERFTQDLIERPEFYFNQQTFFFSDKVLDDYREGRWQVGQQIKAARASNSWPQNTSRCMDYGKCEFLPLCLKQQDAENLYVIVEDNQELTEVPNGK